MQGRGRGPTGTRLSSDARRIVRAQAARATAYGLGSVLVGVTLADRGLTGAEVGVVLFALLAGTALASIAVGRYGDRFGRRRSYRVLFIAMAVAGTVFALTGWLPALILAALSGTVSTDVVESGPFTSLEQAMLPQAGGERDTARLFGTYNTIATLAGSLGALLALVASSPRGLLVYPLAAVVGLAVTSRLSRAIEPLRGGRRRAAAAAPSLPRRRPPPVGLVRARQLRRWVRSPDLHRLPVRAEV